MQSEKDRLLVNDDSASDNDYKGKNVRRCFIVSIVILVLLLLGAITTIFVLAFRDTDNDNKSTKNYHTYSEKNITLYFGKAKQPFTVRFYDDAPNVPYCGFKQFYNTFHEDPIDLHFNGSQFIAKQPNGAILYIDAIDSMLSISDLGLVALDEYDISGDKPKYRPLRQIFARPLRDQNTTINPGTINLGKYHIRLYSENEKSDTPEVFFPLPTIADIYIGAEGQFLGYNEKDLYYFNGFDTVDTYYNDTYWDVCLGSTSRPADLIEYTYNEFCLVFDSFRGLTTQLIIGDNNILGVGLNGALENYCPEIKTLLLSANRREFIVGFYSLLSAMDDGAHTRIVVQDPVIPDDETAAIYARYPSIQPFIQPGKTRRALRDKYSDEVGKVRKQALSLTDDEEESGLYYRSNETVSVALIGFTLFNLQSDLWDAYYKNQGPLPSNDTFPFIVEGIKRAKAEGMERVVLDLSVNGGGAADTLVSILGLLTNTDGYLEYHNVFNKMNMKRWYSIDKAFDGTYNSSALLIDAKLAIMSGPFSYSCGNALPVYSKDNGLLIIGQNSAGGSSVVASTAAPGGLLYRYSGPYSLVTATGANVDPGVEVHTRLYEEKEDGTPDYTHFFDYDKIKAAFDDFYHE